MPAGTLIVSIWVSSTAGMQAIDAWTAILLLSLFLLLIGPPQHLR